ncbi:hypothetical protein [Frankia sp. AvcI1]|uniref:hypothetical protein n=1 Tax=Frankia sp. AvcI1 TaxID=573496 RepID=UPI00211826D5|nr:hypothetical protein [Frankia sp. AvcI1]
MTWVKLDDGFARNRKIAKLSDGAFRLHVSALCWCAEQLTDGHIAAGELREVSTLTPTRARRLAGELVKLGVWDVVPDGWTIHDFLDYNPSRSKVLAEREATARRQQAWRDRHRNGVTNGVTDPSTDGPPDQNHAENEQKTAETSAESGVKTGTFQPDETINDGEYDQLTAHVDQQDHADRNAVTNARPVPVPVPSPNGEEELPPPTPSTDAHSDDGGGGENPEVGELLDHVARAWNRPAASLAPLTTAAAAALATWPADALRRHLATDPPDDLDTAPGLLRHRLDTLPTGPATCGRRCCTTWRSQTDAADRARRAAASADQVQAIANELAAEAARDAAVNDAITEALGPTLTARLVAARCAPGVRPLPGYVRGLLATAYAEHGYLLEDIRAEAAALPDVRNAS